MLHTSQTHVTNSAYGVFRVSSHFDALQNSFAAKLDGLRWVERSYRMACRALGDANRLDGWKGELARKEAMKNISECRASLRDAERQCLKARDALRPWRGVANRILRDA